MRKAMLDLKNMEIIEIEDLFTNMILDLMSNKEEYSAFIKAFVLELALPKQIAGFIVRCKDDVIEWFYSGNHVPVEVDDDNNIIIKGGIKNV